MTQYSLALGPEEIERYRFMAATARDSEVEAWAAAGVMNGARVADVGCGPGLVLLELADLVGRDGSVAGADASDAAVHTATRLIAEAGVTNASVRIAPADETGLAVGSFDTVMIRHVLAHNDGPTRERIVRHAFELLRPGGHLYLVDVDLTGSRTDPELPVVAELLDRYTAHLRDTGRDATIGPRLGSLVRSQGFELVDRGADIIVLASIALATIRPPAWAARDAMRASGHATDDDIARWDAALDDVAAIAVAEQIAVFMPNYTVTARRPEQE